MCGTPVMVTAKECSFCGESLKHHFQLNEEEIRAELIRQFRVEMRALTGFFLIVGAIACAAGWIVLQRTLPIRTELTFDHFDTLRYPAGAALLLLCGFCWIVCGFASAQKQMSAVKAGLIICFPVLIANLSCFAVLWGLFGIALLIPVIRQCRRVYAISRKMQAAGVPLTYKV
jgi:hypothetical protein